MATLLQNRDVRLINAGVKVPNLLHAALPQTAAQNIYTISGGRILLVALFAEVTTVIQAQSTTVKVTSTPTTGSAIDMSSTGADINALEVGGRIALANPPAAATAMVKTNAGYTNLEGVFTIVPIGTISYTTGGSSTGGLKWDLIYVALDDGAQVVAA